jgi:hypothetical protein
VSGFGPSLVTRLGDRPRTSTEVPHRQLSQHATPRLWNNLAEAIFALPGVVEGPSSVGTPSSRAVLLEDLLEPLSAETSLAPVAERLEPVHLHGVEDTSLHLCLPADRAHEVCIFGWGEPHRYAARPTDIMVYGPRDAEELQVVLGLVRESLAFARGVA